MELCIPEKRVPVVGTCDVLVAGGGVAGVAAALAAARHGARTLLVEREYLLGGLATLGLIAIYLPLCDGKGRQVSYGIAEELLRLSIRHGIQGKNPRPWLEGGTREEKAARRFEVQYNPHFFAVLCEKILEEAGVEILYGTLVTGVETRKGSITHLLLENKSGCQAVAAGSVVDTTGDADVCVFSGAPTRIFRQGNLLAQWYYANAEGKLRLHMLGAADIPDKYKKPGEAESRNLADRRYTGLNGFEISEMQRTAHRKFLESVLKHKETAPDFEPVTMPSIPLLRMTRCLVGEGCLDDEDAHRHFADSVGLISDWRKPGPVYEIPFSTLWNRRIPNLLTAGRCISVTDPMWDISRVIPACAVTGQAAGTAAAMFGDMTRTSVPELCAALQQDGVYLHEDLLPKT